MLKPIIALVVWSIIMLVWLYFKRIPAMQKANVNPEDYKLKGPARDILPGDARAASDNYAHLMEQPTIFYAAALAIEVGGFTDGLYVGLGWIYVILRVIHSLIQASQGKVVIRFGIFGLSSIVLAVMAVRLALKLFFG